MGKKDALAKEYMRDSDVFADAFNYFLYGGKEVIKPENLQELDTTSITTFYGDDAKPIPLQRIRDILKRATVMTDGEVTYFLILGIENQTQQDCAMPVRMMAYDLGEYVCQIDAAAKKHGKGGKANLKSEFLSGFRLTDKLIPVVTLTIYLGSDPWVAPRSLHDMFAVQNPELLRHIPNYTINLIEPFQMSEADFEKFHTDLNSVLKYLKSAGSKRQLKELVESDATYKSLAWKTATLLNTLTDSKLKFGRRKERVDMCQAIREMREEAEAKGIEQGIEQGIEKGIGIGLSWLADFVKSGVLTLEQASQKAGLSESEFAAKTGLKL